MEYRLKITESHKHFISFYIKINVSELSSLTLQLPAWRPGRYELGNFAKNIRNFKVVNENEEFLVFKKTSKDSWIIDNIEKENFVFVEYQYYANSLNAGSTLLNEHQLYINPVNCFIYNPNKSNEEFFVYLDVPKSYKTVTSLSLNDNGYYNAISFDELADSPIISGPYIAGPHSSRGVP